MMEFNIFLRMQIMNIFRQKAMLQHVDKYFIPVGIESGQSSQNYTDVSEYQSKNHATRYAWETEF